MDEVRDLRARKTELDRADFLLRYPTPGAFAQALQPRTKQTPALEAIDNAIVEWTQAPDDRGRLMVFCPPQEGKSTKISGWTPLWRLAADPTLRIAIVSYAQNKAERWGRWIRNMITGHPELGIELAPDSRSAQRFETTAGGRVICVGMEGGITGEPVDDLYVDDPLRGRAEAESPTYRERNWEWWESNGATRLSSRGRVVLMLTRWHADDLAGKLQHEEPGEWTVLRIPAIRHPELPVIRGHDGASVYNPDGELISVQGRRPGYFRELKAKRSSYVWRSVYDQDPVAAEGNLFHRADFRYWFPLPRNRERHDVLGGARVLLPDGGFAADGNATGTTITLSDTWRFLTVDLAASTASSADFTVASVWSLTGDGQLILLDRIRQRLEEGNHWQAIKPLTQRWQAADVFVEKGFIGTTMVIDATRAGMRVRPVTPDKDKITRAIPATHRIAAHTVWFPTDANDNCPWLDEVTDELAGFPSWAHDDFVDTLSYAVRVSAANWNPADTKPTQRPPAQPDAVDLAFESVTGTADPLAGLW